ncbi:MAG: hypothetical protein HZA36_00635 [Parcubacteria group bacterium]|nr:hypothetical protein [Parcubacteria group bacterium]
MRKVPLGMYLIVIVAVFLFVFQVHFVSVAAVDNFSVSKDVTIAVQEIKKDVYKIDRGGLNTSFSEVKKMMGDTGKKIVDTLFKPLIKIVIQIAIFFFKLVVSFLEYLKNLF